MSLSLLLTITVALQKRPPPQVPSRGPTGDSYLEVWFFAAKCWEQEAPNRISMEDAQHVLPSRPHNLLEIIGIRPSALVEMKGCDSADCVTTYTFAEPSSLQPLTLKCPSESGSLSWISEKRRVSVSLGILGFHADSISVCAGEDHQVAPYKAPEPVTIQRIHRSGRIVVFNLRDPLQWNPPGICRSSSRSGSPRTREPHLAILGWRN